MMSTEEMNYQWSLRYKPFAKIKVPEGSKLVDCDVIANTRITTVIDREERICQQEERAHVELIAQAICDTRDSHIRKALIELGWTPPCEQ